MEAKRVLVVGATGHLGQTFPGALRERGHDVSILLRPETAQTADPGKRALIDAHISAGARIVVGSLDDDASLDAACADADAVISALTGEQLFLQPALAAAAARSGRVRRFFASEWGVDPFMAAKGTVALLDWKRDLHGALDASGVPMTYVYSNAFATYWGASLGQLGLSRPPEHEITVFGDGTTKIALVTPGDIAKLTVRMLDDDRTAGHEVAIVFAENMLSQNDLIALWESISGRTLTRNVVSAAALDASLASLAAQPDQMMNLIFTQLMKSAWIDGTLGGVRDGVLDAATLYPDFRYERIGPFLERFR